MEQTQPKKQYHVHYGPAGGRTRVDFNELWRYKDLIWLFVKRDFTVLYKQTVLGPAWILINPLLSMAMYTVMFGTIANLSTGGVPQPLFYLAGSPCGRSFLRASTRCRAHLPPTPTSSAKCIFRGWPCPFPQCCPGSSTSWCSS